MRISYVINLLFLEHYKWKSSFCRAHTLALLRIHYKCTQRPIETTIFVCYFLELRFSQLNILSYWYLESINQWTICIEHFSAPKCYSNVNARGDLFGGVIVVLLLCVCLLLSKLPVTLVRCVFFELIHNSIYILLYFYSYYYIDTILIL